MADRAGDRLAWNGSLNETAAGWRRNWESINVYTSWGPEPKRVDDEEANFGRIWADRAKRVIVLDTPEAVRRDLMRFMPDSDQPACLRGGPDPPPATPVGPTPGADDPSSDEVAPPAIDLRSRVWAFIDRAPALPEGGARVGEATAAVTPWPHQVRAFERLYGHWPPRLLIADEVGLGKTIQAGLLLRQARLAGRAKRILILAPKAVLRQWQIELREKFNLNWPIYDGSQFVWYASPALRGSERRAVSPDAWHAEPVVIASSHLMRRRARAQVLLEEAPPWDLVVLDEAHHARRRAAGSSTCTTRELSRPMSTARYAPALTCSSRWSVLCSRSWPGFRAPSPVRSLQAEGTGIRAPACRRSGCRPCRRLAVRVRSSRPSSVRSGTLEPAASTSTRRWIRRSQCRRGRRRRWPWRISTE